MSFFLGNTSQYSNSIVDETKIQLAKIQHEAMSLTFNSMLDTCKEKCIAHEYGESDLNTGEMCCVDRCVAKYVKANLEVGTALQSKGFTPEASLPQYKKINSMRGQSWSETRVHVYTRNQFWGLWM